MGKMGTSVIVSAMVPPSPCLPPRGLRNVNSYSEFEGLRCCLCNRMQLRHSNNLKHEAFDIFEARNYIVWGVGRNTCKKSIIRS